MLRSQDESQRRDRKESSVQFTQPMTDIEAPHDKGLYLSEQPDRLHTNSRTFCDSSLVFSDSAMVSYRK